MKWIFLLLFLLGCTKEYSVYNVTKRGNIFITPKSCDLAEAKVMKWHIGSTFKQTVSKGFRIKIDFPILRKKDLINLAKEKKIDAWLITITKSTTTSDDVIGARYIPLVQPGNFAKGNFRVKQMKHGFLDIYYAAAALSKRFENFRCPAFNHSFIIDKLRLNNRTRSLSKILVSPMERRRASGGVKSFGYLPSVLNGGVQLEGTYSVKIALYNTKTKTTESSTLELPTTVSVISERTRSIKGCADFVIPKKEKDVNKIKQFNWNK